jgi:hypothetical protein
VSRGGPAWKPVRPCGSNLSRHSVAAKVANPAKVDRPRAVAAALKRRRATLPKEPNAKLRGDELLPRDSVWITHTEGKLDVNYCKSLERGS